MRYRKKPVEIEAVQWTGDNPAEVWDFLTYADAHYTDGCFVIPTLEGDMKASPRDFIIKGINGEFYPCKPDIFWKTYDEVKA